MERDVRYLSPEIVEIIGAELKRRRLANSITLEEFGCGCSISYHSKIENGKIIPKLSILQELCEKSGITEKELDSLITLDEKIAKVIEYIFWDNRDEIAKIYEEICMFDNYKSNLIKMVYEIYYLHWDKVKKHSNSIYIIRENIKNNDYYLYIYLLMRMNNYDKNYPEVYSLYKKMKNCKNDFLLALTSKEMLISVCHFGMENPIIFYEEFNKRYKNLLNFSTQEMYELLIETLVNAEYDLPEIILSHLKKEIKLKYFLIRKDTNNIDLYLKENRTSSLEKLLIFTVKKDYLNAEKIYSKLELHKLGAKDLLIANYCNVLNSGNYEELANYIIYVGLDYAKKTNDGQMFKFFLKKLSEISFIVGKYKTVVSMNLSYFEMMNRAKLCTL